VGICRHEFSAIFGNLSRSEEICQEMWEEIYGILDLNIVIIRNDAKETPPPQKKTSLLNLIFDKVAPSRQSEDSQTQAHRGQAAFCDFEAAIIAASRQAI